MENGEKSTRSTGTCLENLAIDRKRSLPTDPKQSRAKKMDDGWGKTEEMEPVQAGRILLDVIVASEVPVEAASEQVAAAATAVAAATVVALPGSF